MEDRAVNHHGSTVSVGDTNKDVVEVMQTERLPGHSELMARDEREEVNARKEYYDKITEETKKSIERKTKLQICKFIGQKLVPVVIFMFTIAYWYYGITSRK